MIRTLASVTALAAVLVLGAAPVAASGHGKHGQDSPWQIGIWKSAPIPKNPDGQFGNQDPFALAHGEHIHTDCSIFWINPADNKLYCFNSGTSKEFFAEDPDRYVGAARAEYLKEKRNAGSRPAKEQPQKRGG